MVRRGSKSGHISLSDVDEYVKDCFEKHSPPQVNELAQQRGLSASALSKQFQRRFGEKPSHVLKERQLARAALLLTTTDLTITEVASAAAFSRRESFDRAFKRATGVSPSEYRQKGKK